MWTCELRDSLAYIRDERTVAQIHEVTSLQLLNWQVMKTGCKPGLLDSRGFFFNKYTQTFLG